MWYEYERLHPSVENGVMRGDVTEFYRFLQRNGAELDYDKLLCNAVEGPQGNAACLVDYVKTLPEGSCLASVREEMVAHCFVIVACGPNLAPYVLDGYDEGMTPPYDVNLLSNYLWIDQVKWLSLVEIDWAYEYRGKRLSKTQKKCRRRKRDNLGTLHRVHKEQNTLALLISSFYFVQNVNTPGPRLSSAGPGSRTRSASSEPCAFGAGYMRLAAAADLAPKTSAVGCALKASTTTPIGSNNNEMYFDSESVCSIVVAAPEVVACEERRTTVPPHLYHLGPCIRRRNHTQYMHTNVLPILFYPLTRC